MGFKSLTLKDEYRSLSDAVARDFFIPVLTEAISYRRAVGYFSSTILIEIARGISNLIRNNGTIQLIASPNLTPEDVEAINKGYEMREQVIERALLRELSSVTDPVQCDRLNLLAYLIAQGRLDIRIAVTLDRNKVGIYHEKMGLFTDTEGCRIAFAGSMNETSSGLSHNYEAIDVFCDWNGDKEKSRVDAKDRAFLSLWNNTENGLDVMDFPSAKNEIIRRYQTGTPNLTLDQEDKDHQVKRPNTPTVPLDVNIRTYQKEAIAAWEAAEYRGIFDMATGTGKTYTALAAIAHLYEKKNENLAVIIVCPFQHLVEQWVEDIVKFGMRPIICYSASTQKDWKSRLKTAVMSFSRGVTEHFCMIATNATYGSKDVQEQIGKLKGNILLVVDEAHNFGASHLNKMLADNIPYRLALSATIERNGDPEGTQRLFDYFGDKCIAYTLKDAIDSHMLTPYFYYPIAVYFDEEELDEYCLLTKKIITGMQVSKTGKVTFSEYAKTILLQRARLVASAKNKIAELRRVIRDYQEDTHMLVYCGATTMKDSDYSETTSGEEELRQVDVVADLLGNEFGMRVAKFTAENSAVERELLKDSFATGTHLQALIAIRCLDEGVNIPSIKTAFILASSTNPKEYIQRRGRVLRKYPGKTAATIYDFITLPFPTDEAGAIPEQVISLVRGLARRELTRMTDFAQIAENPFSADELIHEIKYAFNINDGSEVSLDV